MKEKDEAKAAMADLKESIREVYPEGLPLLDKLERYSGELRRRMAGLNAQIEDLTGTINSQKSRIGLLESLQGVVSRLEANMKRLEQEKAQLAYDLGEVRKIVPEWKEIDGEKSTFINVKAKCLRCGLHFVVCTWEPDRHTADSLYCPECGGNGHFLVWKAPPKERFIFELVPGSDPSAGFSMPMPEDQRKKRRPK